MGCLVLYKYSDIHVPDRAEISALRSKEYVYAS
jgi:hypothetical protein